MSRTIVHIGCRTCDEGDAVYQALQGNHATYHLVTKFRPIMVAPTPRKAATMAAKLLGFDHKFVYTVRGELMTPSLVSVYCSLNFSSA